VETAAKIYTYVVCDLMRRLTSTGVSIAAGAATPDLDALYPSQPRHSYELGSYAAGLLSQSPIDTPQKLAETLSEHLLYRLEELDQDLSYIATRGGNYAVLVDEQERAQALSKILSTHAPSMKITYGTIRQWKGSARNLARSTDYVKAFEKFATTESALEEIEDVAKDVVGVIDRHINDMIDFALGK
jgi:hypothetical protein